MPQLDQLIAYKGAVTLEKAQWDNIAGMTVVFSLEQRPHELTTANPFKKFTKMRKDKVGTRFSVIMVLAEDDSVIVYDDEMMLKGWTDGTNGWKVTFWINSTDGASSLHPFMDFEKGQLFGLAAVELDDDNEAINQDKREKLETPRKKGGNLSNYAAMLCRTDEFHHWLDNQHGKQVHGTDTADLVSKEWMCGELNIESRSELDSNEQAALAFHRYIREPYSKWYHAHYG